MKKKIIGLIPTRLDSTRLPNKALLEINNIPLVIHTYKRAKLSKKLDDLIPIGFRKVSKHHKSGKAGIFAGSLELVKEGNLNIKQDNLFDEIYIKEK